MDVKALGPMVYSGNQADNWKAWLQRFQNYLVASEVDKKTEKVQCAQLIYFIGEEGLKIFNSFTFADNEKDQINLLIKKFTDHFVPKNNVDFERYKFFTMKQGEESIEQFITKLKNAAKLCEFQTLEEGLIKTMVTIGIRNEKTREKLLQNEKLTLEKAVELCIICENTRNQTQIMKNNAIALGGHSADGEVAAIRRSKLHHHQPDRNNTGGRSARTQGHGPNTSDKGTIFNCTRCGKKSHPKNKCPAYNQICNKCKKRNHFAAQCQQSSNRVNEIRENLSNSDISIDAIDRNKVESGNSWTIELNVCGTPVDFKIDTGASANVINQKTLKEIQINQKRKINYTKNTSHKLITYTGAKIPIRGLCKLNVCHKNVNYVLDFHVVSGNYKSILGIQASEKLKLIKRIDLVQVENKREYEKLILKFNDVFKGIGKMSKPYHIELDPQAAPKTYPVRKVPFALRDKYKKTLDQLTKSGIVKPVEGSSEWVHPVVLVKKPNGSLRICLDPRELNKAIKREYQALPTIDELIANLNGAKFFSILDATHGFWNVQLDEESSRLCTFGTPFGMYRFLRMPYGIKSAPEVFQKRFKEIFTIEGVEIYIDDILIWGKTKQEHDERLEKVLETARRNNVKLNPKKCKLGVREIKYLGHQFSSEGISIDQEKIQAIKDISSPKNKKETQRLMGFFTYLGRFINQLSEISKPIRDLLRNEVEFRWTNAQEDALSQLKQEVIKNTTLQYFNPKEEVTISVDASQNGLGATMIQGGKPCAYASRSLSETQQRYAQIEKELLAICFGVSKFHQYIFGQKCKIETDHKPLISIFNKPLMTCPVRLQRMLLSLQRYDLEVVYRPGKELIIADTLSRSSSKIIYEDNLNLEEQICLIETNVKITDKRRNELREATEEDEDLKLLKKFTRSGWPQVTKNLSRELKIYHKFRNEITEANGLLYKIDKCIIPKSKRPLVLGKIHSGHFGINKCRARANKSLYWPGIDDEIQMMVNKCRTCQKYSKSNQPEPLQPHHIPEVPWYKVGIDLFEIRQQNFLLVVDYYSKFVEVEKMKNITAELTIEKLKRIFSTHGIPAKVVSDPGTQFTSKKFEKFASDWNFMIDHVAPKNQQANGQAERAIQTTKKLIKKCVENDEDVEMALLSYRNTPIHGSLTPAEILMSRPLRDNLSFNESKLGPRSINLTKYNNYIVTNQQKYQKQFNKKAKPLQKLEPGQTVKYQEYPKSTWKFAKVKCEIRNRTYKIVTENGKCLIRNRRHLNPTAVLFKKQNSDSGNHSIFDQQLLADLINDKTDVPNNTSSDVILDNKVILSDYPHQQKSKESDVDDSDVCASPDTESDSERFKDCVESPESASSDRLESQIVTRVGRTVKKPDRLDM